MSDTTQAPLIPTILCGGAGTRLWPLSRDKRPKQLHTLVGDCSLLRQTMRRALALPGVTPAHLLFISGESTHDVLRADAREEGGDAARIVLEPEPKNTAAAVGLACFAASEVTDDAIVLVLPSDHFVADTAGFADLVKAALPLAQAGEIVTFGIAPTHAASGYGYILRGEGMEPGYRIAAFEEKPTPARAQTLIDGGAMWNAGIFMFRADRMLEELREHTPAVLDAVEAAWAGRRAQGLDIRLDATAWSAAPSIPIDKAVAEKTNRGAVVPAGFAWTDVGSWAALHELEADASPNSNVTRGPTLMKNSQGCYVFSHGGRLVAVLGVEDLLVIDTPDALLIAPKAKAQDVKLIHEELKRNGHGDLL